MQTKWPLLFSNVHMRLSEEEWIKTNSTREFIEKINVINIKKTKQDMQGKII